MTKSVFADVLPRAVIAFLVGLLLCGAYYVSWQYSRWSGVPGFIIILGSFPWTLPWFEWLQWPVRRLVGWHIRGVLDVLFVSLGFSLNLAIACGTVMVIWRRLVKRRGL